MSEAAKQKPWDFEVDETSDGPAFSVYDWDGDRLTDPYVSEAQARLIASAPDLLAALRSLVAFYGLRAPASPEDPDALLPAELQEPEIECAMRAISRAESTLPADRKE